MGYKKPRVQSRFNDTFTTTSCHTHAWLEAHNKKGGPREPPFPFEYDDEFYARSGRLAAGGGIAGACSGK